MSSPNFVVETALAEYVEDLLFGRIVERRFFRDAVDWVNMMACDGEPVAYIEKFLTAFTTNASLPALPDDVIIISVLDKLQCMVAEELTLPIHIVLNIKSALNQG